MYKRALNVEMDDYNNETINLGKILFMRADKRTPKFAINCLIEYDNMNDMHAMCIQIREDKKENKEFLVYEKKEIKQTKKQVLEHIKKTTEKTD